MKKPIVLFTISILVILSSNLYSQTFGLKFGANFTNYVQGNYQFYEVDAPPIMLSEKGLGFSFGAFYTLDISKKFQIQPEIYYIKTRSNDTWNMEFFFWLESPETVLEKLNSYQKLDLIKIPILLKYRMSIFRVFAGPYISYMLKAREVRREVIEIFGLEPYDIDLLNEDESGVKLNRINYGAMCGLGFEKGSLSAEVRYSFDLSDNMKDAGEFTKYKLQYSSISILVGWKF